MLNVCMYVCLYVCMYVCIYVLPGTYPALCRASLRPRPVCFSPEQGPRSDDPPVQPPRRREPLRSASGRARRCFPLWWRRGAWTSSAGWTTRTRRRARGSGCKRDSSKRHAEERKGEEGITAIVVACTNAATFGRKPLRRRYENSTDYRLYLQGVQVRSFQNIAGR